MNQGDLKPYNVGFFQHKVPTNTVDYQKSQWGVLSKSISYQLSRNVPINETVVELIKLNLIRGQGLFVRSIMKLQLENVHLTPEYASIAAVINSKFEEIGNLLLRRLVLQFRKAYLSDDKSLCISSSKFLAHLVNQKVVNEVLILQMIQLLLQNVTNDSMEIVFNILKVVGRNLNENSKPASTMIMTKLRDVLQGNQITEIKSIETILDWNRNAFSKYPILPKYLDLVEEQDQTAHFIELGDGLNASSELDLFLLDEKYNENEKAYDTLKKEILEAEKEEEEEEAHVEEKPVVVIAPVVDLTEADILQYQKTVYLKIMSSMSADEAVHKLLQLTSKDKKDRNNELMVDMVIKCCSQEKTYSKYFGVIGEKLCLINKSWEEVFSNLFKTYYGKIDKFENNAIRNIGKFFGHLFGSNALPLTAWDEVKLTEEHTNSASRIFLKFIIQEMIEEVGLTEIKERLVNDPVVIPYVNGVFPIVDVTWKDADAIRFSINYFTAIGLGVLTDKMRVVLKELPQPEFTRGRSRSRSSSFSRSGSSYSRSRSTSSRSYSRSRSNSRDESGALKSRDESGALNPSKTRLHNSEWEKKEDEKRPDSGSYAQKREPEEPQTARTRNLALKERSLSQNSKRRRY